VAYGVFGINKFCEWFSEVYHYTVLTRADSCFPGWCMLVSFGDTLFVCFSDEVRVVSIDALMGRTACVSDFHVPNCLLKACEGFILLSVAFSVLESVADVLEGRADYGYAFVSV
jgi:hypothetical protein